MPARGSSRRKGSSGESSALDGVRGKVIGNIGESDDYAAVCESTDSTHSQLQENSENCPPACRSAEELHALFSEYSAAITDALANGRNADHTHFTSNRSSKSTSGDGTLNPLVSISMWTDVSILSAGGAENAAGSKTEKKRGPSHSYHDIGSSGVGGNGTAGYNGRHATSKWTQFQMLMHRGWLTTIRNTTTLKTMVIKNVVVAGVVGIVFLGKADVSEPFFDIDKNGNVFMTSDVTNLTSALFFAMMYCLMSNLDGIPALCDMNRIYRRELSAFAYSSSAYWAASCLIYIPSVICGHAIFNTLAYFLCAFPMSLDYFVYFFFVLLLTNFSAFYFSQLLAASFGDAKVAFGIFPLPFIFLTMFAGYTMPVNNIPEGWKWASIVSYCRWGYEGLMSNAFERFDEGKEVLKIYDFDNYNRFKSYWVLIIVIGVMAGLNYLAMRPARSKLQYCEDGIPLENKKRPNGTASDNKQQADPAGFSESTLMTNLLSSCETEEALNSAYGVDVEGQYSAIHVGATASHIGSQMDSQPHLAREASTTSSDVFASPGCTLVFKDLEYSVPLPRGKSNSLGASMGSGEDRLRILKGVSGQALPGEVMALMGASGAGRSHTTCLNPACKISFFCHRKCMFLKHILMQARAPY